MSDLISKQELLRVLENDLSCFETDNKSEKEMYIAVSDMRKMIQEQPTVYDVNKIVEQLKNPNNYTIISGKHFTTVERAIDIVKKGGML